MWERGQVSRVAVLVSVGCGFCGSAHRDTGEYVELLAL